MSDLQPVFLIVGLLGLGLFGTSSNEDPDSDSSSSPDEASSDDASTHDSPFAPDADEPFDLDYKEPDSPAENPFASEDEEPVDTDTVPHARPDGSSPFEDVATSVDESPSSDGPVRTSSTDDSNAPRTSPSSPSPPASSSRDASNAPPAADSDADGPDEDALPRPELDVDASVLPSDLDLSAEGQCRSESSSSPHAPSEEDPSSQKSLGQEGTQDMPSRGASAGDASTQGSTSHESASPGLSPPNQQTLHSVSDARTLSDTAMALFHDDKLDGAFAYLERHWRSSMDELNVLRQEIERMRTDVGEKHDAPIDYRFVRTDDVADALIRFSYLERFKHHGLRWTFTFYKGESGWTLNDLSFDDDLDALFD